MAFLSRVNGDGFTDFSSWSGVESYFVQFTTSGQSDLRALLPTPIGGEKWFSRTGVGINRIHQFYANASVGNKVESEVQVAIHWDSLVAGTYTGYTTLVGGVSVNINITNIASNWFLRISWNKVQGGPVSNTDIAIPASYLTESHLYVLRMKSRQKVASLPYTDFGEFEVWADGSLVASDTALEYHATSVDQAAWNNVFSDFLPIGSVGPLNKNIVVQDAWSTAATVEPIYNRVTDGTPTSVVEVGNLLVHSSSLIICTLPNRPSYIHLNE